MWLDVAGCGGGSIYDVPGGGQPGSNDYRSITVRVPHDGRIVAGGAHLHGGAKEMDVTQPRCGNRRLLESRALYGNPDHIFYHVLPVLHEPGPINTSWFLSSKGIPVHRGEQLRGVGVYDAEWPHARVMAIDHIYLARDDAVAQQDTCAPLPDDIENRSLDYPGRTEPPRVVVPITALDRNGNPFTISRPPGRTFHYAEGATVDVLGLAFRQPNISVASGAEVTWRFRDSVRHNVAFANGPRAFSSLNLRAGQQFRHRFSVPGVYRLMCTLHPVTMEATVRVRPAGG
jgi:plastocyanin